MALTSFAEAEAFLRSRIPKLDGRAFRWDEALERMKALLARLGDPQEKLKVIHIAGTSGKGSTAVLLASLLHAHGFRVGLSLSPHIHDLRERVQIGGLPVDDKRFVSSLAAVLDAAGDARPTYFELIIALAFCAFAGSEVGYCIMETGMGGLYDATNTVKNRDKLVLLTRIGIDHERFLGHTIAKIAPNKAAIVQEQNTVLSVPQHDDARHAIEARAAEKHAKLTFIAPPKDVVLSEETTSFGWSGTRHSTSLLGLHQAENACLALAALETLGRRDGFAVDGGRVAEALGTARFPGRFERFEAGGKTVIVDGAHNVQKMERFCESLALVYPDRRFDFLVAFKRDKDSLGMLRSIVPLARSVTITSFFSDDQDLVHLSKRTAAVKEECASLGIAAAVVPEPRQALMTVLGKGGDVVVTGSLYLIGAIYDEIVSASRRGSTTAAAGRPAGRTGGSPASRRGLPRGRGARAPRGTRARSRTRRAAARARPGV
ncbi:hypothetical protein JXB02_01210 [Candidatus Woesearchaeota archaeon]|nr:hypothetical protein [Candidatus Woesearchaeota archaeon]